MKSIIVHISKIHGLQKNFNEFYVIFLKWYVLYIHAEKHL